MDSPSTKAPKRVPVWAIVGALVLVGVGVGVGVWLYQRSTLPKPGEARYERYVELFELGTAALDTNSLTKEAEEYLTKAIDLVPGEPAAWANRGLFYTRMSRLEEATNDLEQASSLAPGHPAIEGLQAVLHERKGDLDRAVKHAQAALEKRPNDFRHIAMLDKYLKIRNAPGVEEQRQQLIERMLAQQPYGLPLLSQRLELAVRRKDQKLIAETLARYDQLAPAWVKPDARKQLNHVKEDIRNQASHNELLIRINQLDNQTMAEHGYARLGLEMRPPPGKDGTSLQNFIRLSPIRTTPDQPDTALTFAPCSTIELPASGKPGQGLEVQAVWLTRDSEPQLLTADETAVHVGKHTLAIPKSAKPTSPTMNGIVAVDWNNDSRTDFILAGAGGLRFYRQTAAGSFEDVSSATKLPGDLLQGDHYGAWAADFDMDGDLDIVLAPRAGPVILMRNNSDGTFTPQPSFASVRDARAFLWADIDNDGAPDAAFLDADGALHVQMNERSGMFRQRKAPQAQGKYAALAAADINADSTFDLIILKQDGGLLTILDAERGEKWETRELGYAASPYTLSPGACRLVAVDVDSNGSIDFVLRAPAGGSIWLSDGNDGFQSNSVRVPPGIADPFPTGKEGLVFPVLDKGKVSCQNVVGTKGYNARQLRFRHDPGGINEQRINSFTLGSECEFRTGSLIVKQPIDRPALHLGLGKRDRIDVMRIVWTSGASQYELKNPGEEVITVGQRLTGSCPFLFTWDGQKMVFVTDFCWSTPLGLYINAQKRGGVMQTREWLKIAGERLAPRDGIYDIRVNANLWETHYLDLLGIRVVDHPPGTELHLDERFFLTPTLPRVFLTTTSQPVLKATDHHGKDVTALVKETDGTFLANAGLGRYQGITTDHFVEVEIGAVPGDGPLYLLAHGWLQPTDSSINFALEQSSHDRPRPLTLEVQSETGWKQFGPPLGFPAGKNKTMVIPLEGVAIGSRIRLRTNLEMYWNSLRLARGVDEKQCRSQTLKPRTADLRYRGIVRMNRVSRFHPELPNYDDLAGTGQEWRDLIGYHTRFGDVRELVENVDDRYVLMNAGDELRMTFAVPDAPPSGWKRDFVWISDGWTKDGNLNTRFGKTVLPLPAHDMKDYDTPPGNLEDDPVYQRHKKDWDVYHTRFVSPELFQRGLRVFDTRRTVR